MNDGERAIKDEDCLGALGVCLLEGCFVLIRLARLDCDQLYSQLSAGLGSLGNSSWCADMVGSINTAMRDGCGTNSFSNWSSLQRNPFGGPDAVLAYLSRYTHRTAIANSRLVAFAGERVTFKWKDYRAKGDARYKLMTLDANEFIRRFLIHVLPDGFPRIRPSGLFANANR